MHNLAGRARSKHRAFDFQEGKHGTSFELAAIDDMPKNYVCLERDKLNRYMTSMSTEDADAFRATPVYKLSLSEISASTKPEGDKLLW